MIRFIREQADTVSTDPAMRVYGAILAGLSGLTGTMWLTTERLDDIVANTSAAICWPFFEQCRSLRVLSSEGVVVATLMLVLASCVNVWLFIERQTAAAGYVVFGILTACRIVVIAMDYRLALNQHYMMLVVAAIFLFDPKRKRTIPVVIVLFYFWAGTLKLNSEWLSGASLYGRRPMHLPVSLISLSCYYVVVLELVIAWGLLARGAVWFWLTFVQLVVFHISSFWVVGYFYPIVMFGLLAIIPVLRHERLSSEPDGYSRLIALRGAFPAAIAFSSLQLFARTFPGDRAVTGEGRMWALNMFDAPVHCTAVITVHMGSEIAKHVVAVPFLQPRLSCDPVVYREAAINECREYQRLGENVDVDLQVDSGRTAAAPYRLIDAHAVCSHPLVYSLITHNKWIHLD